MFPKFHWHAATHQPIGAQLAGSSSSLFQVTLSQDRRTCKVNFKAAACLSCRAVALASATHDSAAQPLVTNKSCCSIRQHGNSDTQQVLRVQKSVRIRFQRSLRCRQGNGDTASSNGQSGGSTPNEMNSNGGILDADNNGGSGGSKNPPNNKSTDSDSTGDDAGNSNNRPKPSSVQVKQEVAIAAAAGLGFLAVISVAALRWAAEAQNAAATALAAVSQVEDPSISGLSTADSINALKRLLREVFADNIALKARLDSLEKAAAEELEAADDFQLQVLSAGSSNSNTTWARAPVRMCGCVSAAGILPWTQERPGADTAAMLAALGATGQAEGSLSLHSVLAGGKRRVTAELRHIHQQDGQPALQLARLLYRVQIKKWLQLMIAPLGGSLDAIARGVTPVKADYGCTHALRKGHGLSVFDRLGSGKAISVSKGGLSAAAGFFVGGSAKTSIAQVQLQGKEGQSLSLVAANCRSRQAAAQGEDGNSSSSSFDRSQTWFRFLGALAPGCRSSSSKGHSSDSLTVGTVVGAAGVLPIGEAATATVWAEKPSSGQPGWGVSMYSQPDPQGFEAGLAIGRPSANNVIFRGVQLPLFCEVTAKVPVGDGLSISPGTVITFRDGKGTVSYLMQSSWRF